MEQEETDLTKKSMTYRLAVKVQFNIIFIADIMADIHSSRFESLEE